jgi:hypothetical protein
MITNSGEVPTDFSETRGNSTSLHTWTILPLITAPPSSCSSRRLVGHLGGDKCICMQEPWRDVLPPTVQCIASPAD